MSFKSARGIVQRTVNNFVRDQVPTLGAALAYYAIFSLAPMLVIAVGVAGLIFSDQKAQELVTQQLQGVLGQRSASVIQSMMSAQTRTGSLWAMVIGIITLLLGASGVFGQLKSSLNLIWRVKPKPGRGVWGMVLERLVSLLMVLAIGVLLMVSMLLGAVVTAFQQVIGQMFSLPTFVAPALHLLVSLVTFTLLFGLLFKVLPDVRVRWRDVLRGSFLTALLFVVGEFLLGFYLGRQGTSSAYGAAGSVVLLLMWIYYSSLILFTGAEFTRAWARESGSQIEPRSYAERIDPVMPQPKAA